MYFFLAEYKIEFITTIQHSIINQYRVVSLSMECIVNKLGLYPDVQKIISSYHYDTYDERGYTSKELRLIENEKMDKRRIFYNYMLEAELKRKTSETTIITIQSHLLSEILLRISGAKNANHCAKIRRYQLYHYKSKKRVSLRK